MAQALQFGKQVRPIERIHAWRALIVCEQRGVLNSLTADYMRAWRHHGRDGVIMADIEMAADMVSSERFPRSLSHHRWHLPTVSQTGRWKEGERDRYGGQGGLPV
ncbi:hypothetical protein GCM10027066_33000 [Dyella jejuensis]